jgi:hypothetical protein
VLEEQVCHNLAFGLCDVPARLAGTLPDFPDVDWQAFEQASELALLDLNAGGPPEGED